MTFFKNIILTYYCISRYNFDVSFDETFLNEQKNIQSLEMLTH